MKQTSSETFSEDNPVDPDADGSLFDLFAKLNISISTIGTQLDAQNKRERAKLLDLPRSFMLPYSLITDSNGQGMATIGGPQPGREWIVREITAVDSGYLSESNTGASNTGAAGAATSVTINGQSLITGFDVSIGPATTTGTATVTLSGVNGGPYTYYIDELVGSSEFLSKSLNLIARNSATLSVSAVASGGIVAVNLYGTTGISGADLTWYVGQNINQGINTPLPQSMVFARMHSIPAELTYTSDVVRIVQNQQLIVGAMAATANSTINGMAKILDMPAFGERQRVASQ